MLFKDLFGAPDQPSYAPTGNYAAGSASPSSGAAKPSINTSSSRVLSSVSLSIRPSSILLMLLMLVYHYPTQQEAPTCS